MGRGSGRLLARSPRRGHRSPSHQRTRNSGPRRLAPPTLRQAQGRPDPDRGTTKVRVVPNRAAGHPERGAPRTLTRATARGAGAGAAVLRGGRTEDARCSSGARHARLRGRDRQRGARHPTGAARRWIRIGHLCRDGRPRLEDLTVDYRDLPDASHPDNILIHHFSIGSRASRIAYALPDRMMLVYHNITPPEYFIDVHPLLMQQCFLGRRELGLYASRCELALGDSEFNRLELESAGFPATGVLPVVPDFAHLSARPTTCTPGELRRRLGEPAVCRPNDSEQAASRT